CRRSAVTGMSSGLRAAGTREIGGISGRVPVLYRPVGRQSGITFHTRFDRGRLGAVPAAGIDGGSSDTASANRAGSAHRDRGTGALPLGAVRTSCARHSVASPDLVLEPDLFRSALGSVLCGVVGASVE